MGNDEIPELKAVNDSFFDVLAKVRTRAAMEAAAQVYKNQLAGLRDRGIITERHYRALRFVIPMRVDYAWAKNDKQVGTQEEVEAGEAEVTAGKWAERYIEKEPVKDAFKALVGTLTGPPLLAFFPKIAKFYPESLVEVLRERAEQIERTIPKIPKLLKPEKWPWWAWALIGTAGLGFGAYVLRSVTATVHEARKLVE